MTKGTFYQIIARFAFLLSSYLIHITMAYFLADPKDYGDLGVIISMMTIARVFLSTGLPQTTSRFVAMEDQHEGAIFRKSLQIQIVCSLVVFAAYSLGTPLWIHILNDNRLTGYILISSLLIPSFGVLQIFLAYLSGKGRFGQQAFYIGIYSAGRFLFALILVILGMKIMGVLFGYILAASITLAILCVRISVPKSDEVYRVRKLISFSVPIVFFSIAISLLLNFDVLLLKHFFSDSPLIGYYTGAMNLGKIPYFILYAYSVTLLPMVSKALGNNDNQEAKVIVRKSISSLLLIVVSSSAIVVATAEPLLDFVYPSEYRLASRSLIILFFSMSGLALLHSLCSIITAKGKPHFSMLILFLCVPIQVGFGVWLAPRYDIVGVAAANLIAVLVGLTVASVTVFYYFGGFFELAKVGKALLASGAMFYMVKLLPPYPVEVVPIVCVLSFVAFTIIMFLLGGFSIEELKAIKVTIYKMNLSKRLLRKV